MGEGRVSRQRRGEVLRRGEDSAEVLSVLLALAGFALGGLVGGVVAVAGLGAFLLAPLGLAILSGRVLVALGAALFLASVALVGLGMALSIFAASLTGASASNDLRLLALFTGSLAVLAGVGAVYTWRLAHRAPR